MKLENNARYVAYDILVQVLINKGYSNIILQNQLHHVLEKDQALCTKIVYGVIQNYDLLCYQLEFIEYKKLSNKHKILLVMALYQKHFLDKIPDYAIVNDTIEITKNKFHQVEANFIQAMLSQLFKNELIYSNSNDIDLDLSINYSHPLWLVKMLKKQYGEEDLIKILKANNENSIIHLRNNAYKQDYHSLIDNNPLFEKASVTNNGLIYHGNDIGNLDEYLEGKISVQDLSSQMVAELLNPKENSKVLDMCAAPGTKTCHMAEIMKNTGHIKAYDIHEHKMNLIKSNALRLNLSNIETSCYDSTKLLEIEELESYDYILCDALCTGIGVIKRKPEIKYQDLSNGMDEIIKIQEQLLDVAYQLLKVGGTLVYSTCTLNKKENEFQINKLIEKYPQLEVEEMKSILPYVYNSDGFFMSKLVKK